MKQTHIIYVFSSIIIYCYLCGYHLDSYAQVPQKFSYQSVIRDASNQIVANQQVGMKISIVQGSEAGTIAYAETHSPTTNTNGLVSVIVGDGTVVEGDISTINWGNGTYYLKTETDPSGGTNYSITIVNQILSVPYALFSKRANSVEIENDPSVPTGTQKGEIQYWNGTQWIILNPGNQSQLLTFCDGVPMWTTNGICPCEIAPDSPTQSNHVSSDTYINWNWSSVANATGYKWNTTGSYATAINLGNTTTVTQTGLNSCQEYNIYVWAYNICGKSGVQLTSSTTGVPSHPVEGTHIPYENQIVWNWSSVPNATGYKWHTKNNYAGATDLGNVTTVTQTNLICNTFNDIYVWAYNTCGNSDETILSQNTAACPFVCNDNYTDSRDNTIYQTVQIDNQCWMKENLKYLPQIGCNASNYCFYVYNYSGTDVSEAKANQNYITYGALYNWDAATASCPAGWHLPSAAEWSQLINYLGGIYVAGGKLKTTNLWAEPNEGATNSSGFSALPAGYRYTNGTFHDKFLYSGWWTTTSEISSEALYLYVSYEDSFVTGNNINKDYGCSVRCVKN